MEETHPTFWIGRPHSDKSRGALTKPHDMIKMNDNINMDSRIAGLMNTHS
jgi:hypothetical protein